MTKYHQLAITKPEDLVFGTAPNPVKTRRGLIIGGGDVYPEINLTLPPIEINEQNYREIKRLYSEAVEDFTKRAVELNAPGFVIEFETLIEMTTHPHMAIELTKMMNDILESYYQKHGLKTALRITVNDTRELIRPPLMRHGEQFELMMQAFEGCAKNGAEFLSIESTGGKELHDNALLMCNINEVIFSLISMGCRDMDFLWTNIDNIAKATGTIAAGDTACGFANTAMVLADRHMIPKVFSSIDRIVSAVRSLVAYEKGAVGPGKDCGYENVYIKAITGAPMSMEGKAAACAHLSPLGNIAGATCDLWSNESIQMIKLLGGMAPTVSMEQLIYDCRLMNTATRNGKQLILRDLMAASDAPLDPQALILTPESVIRISNAIIGEKNYYRAAIKGALEGIAIIDESFKNGRLDLHEMEVIWIDQLRLSLQELPADESLFIDSIQSSLDYSKFRPEEYTLSLDKSLT